KLRERSQVDENGLLVELEITGHAYMGAPVNERFNADGNAVTWSSTLESGQAESGAYYWPSDGTPVQAALLARALLQSESGSLPLYPAGEASIRKVTEHAINGDPAQLAVLYAITGLGFTPEYVWLDAANELLALTYGWMGLAPGGQAGILPELQALQDKAEADRSRRLAKELAKPLPDKWLLRNVNVVDVETATTERGRMVAVENGHISGIWLDSDVVAEFELKDFEVLDGKDGYLIPGLWDMHTHLSLEDGLLQIAAGVTTVRDLANDEQRLNDVRAAFDSGSAIGPHSYRAGFIDKKSPYSAPTGKLAESLDDALAMIEEYAAGGYPQIKIYSSIEPAWVAPMARAIHADGMRLSGHIPSGMTAEQAVKDGFDEIQHINMLFLNFLAGPEDDTRTPVRFRLVAEKGGDLDLDSAEVVAFVQLLADRGIEVDPTVTIFDSMFRHRSGEIDPSYAKVADHLPVAVRRGMLAGEMDITDENAARYAQSAQALLNMILRLYQAGVPLVAGTDALAGFTLHRELELYQQAGLPAEAVLRIATLGSAKVVGADETTGSISIGKSADMVLLRDDPLQEISAVRQPMMVFKQKYQYDPNALYQAIGVKPFN
ncbi:MAG TPA: amidohydrolase family protein, partial [Xanthomonadales bacterium]|nr:amidohydrolase family protein [Xanthomonadales bacterium]